jgi:hypothetical protein
MPLVLYELSEVTFTTASASTALSGGHCTTPMAKQEKCSPRQTYQHCLNICVIKTHMPHSRIFALLARFWPVTAFFPVSAFLACYCVLPC